MWWDTTTWDSVRYHRLQEGQERCTGFSALVVDTFAPLKFGVCILHMLTPSSQKWYVLNDNWVAEAEKCSALLQILQRGHLDFSSASFSALIIRALTFVRLLHLSSLYGTVTLKGTGLGTAVLTSALGQNCSRNQNPLSDQYSINSY